MPFERYLHVPVAPDDLDSEQHPSYNAHPRDRRNLSLDPSIFSTNVQFQVPQLMLGPALPPGGGAEVLPHGTRSRQQPAATETEAVDVMSSERSFN